MLLGLFLAKGLMVLLSVFSYGICFQPKSRVVIVFHSYVNRLVVADKVEEATADVEQTHRRYVYQPIAFMLASPLEDGNILVNHREVPITFSF